MIQTQGDAHMRAILINGVNSSCLLKGLEKLQMSLKILARSSKGALCKLPKQNFYEETLTPPPA